MEKIIMRVLLAMQAHLTREQLQLLETTLRVQLRETPRDEPQALAVSDDGWERTLRLYIASKRLENLSGSTLENYARVIRMMMAELRKPLREITTNDLRYYLAVYQQRRKVSLSYLDTLRRYISAFFSWCQDEGIITVNPARRLKRVKVPEKIREPYSPTEIQKLHEAARTERDLAIMEVLYSTAGRIGEICALDRSDIDWAGREIVIYGQKGKRERRVYLTESACYHLRKYLESRTDDNPALFVSLRAPHERLQRGAVEAMLSKLGRACGVHAHPHKFRRTLLTDGGRRGIPLQELQQYAGHVKPETTMIYVTVADASVKASFDRYIA